MINAKKFKDANVSIPVPVDAGTVGGDVVVLGADGLLGVAKTDRATAATIAAGTAAPGLAANEATVILLGVALVLELTLALAATQFDEIFRAGDGTYTNDSAAVGAVKIGYAVETIDAPGAARVALIGSN